MAPKTTHYLFIFPDGTFLFPGLKLWEGKQEPVTPATQQQPLRPEDVGSEARVAPITVPSRKWLLVSGSTPAFSFPSHLGGARVVLPAFMAYDT